MVDVEQQEQEQRVASVIGEAVCAFMREMNGREFCANDLRTYVLGVVNRPIAPASPTTILRALRKTGEVDYLLVSRPKSIYRSLGCPRVTEW